MTEERQTPEIEVADVQASPQPPSPSALRDKRVVPEGVVPKQAQGYVVAGLAVLILLAVMFSKNHTKTAPAPAAVPPSSAPFSNDVNARRIAELEQNLDEEQRQSQQAQKTNAAGATATAQPGSAGAPVAPLPSATPATTEPQRDPIADAEKAMAFKARFASNLVSSDVGASRPSASSADSANANVLTASGPATHAARSVGLPLQPPAAQIAVSAKRSPEVNINSAHGQPFVVFEGTAIDTVLTNRLDGEFAGPVKVMVSNPVYSHDGQHVLIPEGSFILGEVQKVSGFGQKRLAVTFHRLLMPDGYSVDLDQFHGLDQVGDTGLKDKVNNHYLEVFGTSIALGVIAGAAEATNSSGYNQTGTDAYRQGIASSLSQSSANVLDRFINIPPTITIRECHRIKVYIT